MHCGIAYLISKYGGTAEDLSNRDVYMSFLSIASFLMIADLYLNKGRCEVKAVKAITYIIGCTVLGAILGRLCIRAFNYIGLF